MTPETITIIAAVLAGAAGFGLAVALRALDRERRRTATLRHARDQAIDLAERYRIENRQLQARTKPAPDGSLGSLGSALRKLTGPVKPTSARTPSASRNDSPDLISGMAMGSLLAPGGWSAPSTDTPSCDTSSSSSSDGGSCGGGE